MNKADTERLWREHLRLDARVGEVEIALSSREDIPYGHGGWLGKGDESVSFGGAWKSLPFRMYYNRSTNRVDVKEGPFYWWFPVENSGYGSVVGWFPVGWSGATGIQWPSAGYRMVYAKLERTPSGYGAGDTFDVSIDSVTGSSVENCESAMCAFSAWNVFVHPIGYMDSNGSLSQVHLGALRFRDIECPGTVKLWLGSPSSIPAGWEVVTDLSDGDFLRAYTSGGGAHTDGTNFTDHDHGVTLTKDVINSGTGYAVDVVTDVSVNPQTVIPPHFSVVLIRKL